MFARITLNAIRNKPKIRSWGILDQHFCRRDKSDKHSSIVKAADSGSEIGVDVKPLGEKVRETTKTASYMGVILLGVAVTGSLFYAVFSELFSSKSPNNVYTNAVKKCLSDTRVEDKLGYPIAAYGEETRRGRRQHPTHVVYKRNGKQCIRMKFYLKGSAHKGTVQLEMVEDDSGKYEYRYLFVQVEDLFQTTIILEDNRNKHEHISKEGLTLNFNELIK
ncbi:mitochondrial import inner membrane translocase subunit Tim21 [Coccinella septempunctata]|uniref:mitochondrial import inner membrane translocase subunit Tim21 n=1 Tax=Coccinella septempunctata TaxID=41139 RepID=UPI001D061FFA|nr:mitochondrial import inner membrane translocase subunit Tim21 [Coccinella septempunctata]